MAWRYPSCLRTFTVSALLVKATKKVIVGSPLPIFIPHAVEGLPNSHHTQPFSVSPLNSYEALLLTTPHVTLLQCNNFNPGTLLPTITNDISHDCLTLMDHLLTPGDNLQAIPLGNTGFSWFTDGSYLKGDNGKYCAV